ncbi:MAG: amino acid permease, partial [Polymorphobacter sp.]
MSTPATGQLLRVLGPGFALAVVIGGIIGSGIMRSPGLVAAAIPDPTLIMLAWAAGGLLVLVYALPTVELAASMPHAGGSYVFADRAYGPLVGLI